MHDAVATLALLALSVAAAAWDLATRRIPNVLTVSGFLVALVLRAVHGPAPLLDGLAAAGLAIVLTLPLALAGGLGGGDVKLLAAVGAFLGPERLLTALVVTALTGGAIVLALAWRRGSLAELAGHTARIVRRLVPFGARRPVRTLATPGASAIPYGVPIALGALVGWFA